MASSSQSQCSSRVSLWSQLTSSWNEYGAHPFIVKVLMEHLERDIFNDGGKKSWSMRVCVCVCVLKPVQDWNVKSFSYEIDLCKKFSQKKNEKKKCVWAGLFPYAPFAFRKFQWTDFLFTLKAGHHPSPTWGIVWCQILFSTRPFSSDRIDPKGRPRDGLSFWYAHALVWGT